MDEQDEFDGIVVALDVLLTAIADDNRSRDRAVAYSVRDSAMSRTWRETELELQAADLIRNPVGQALRNAVKLLGERLNERGGVGLMRDALEGAAGLKPEQAGWREAILDRLWNGIGTWLA